ncbi:MAG: ABC transporter ATP-binding protein [Chloroflexi bacterium]|nr:ABC transporter ATP-binding protein [Chloroflexota bacterium]
MALLEIKDLHVSYGHIAALRGINLDIDDGEIVTLIGANGAGKTTTLNAISGLVKPERGLVLLRGEDLTALAPHAVVTRGVVQVPEGRRVFARLTVFENLEMGGFTVRGSGEKRQRIEQVFSLFPRLRERRHQLAGTLSGGEQQMLAIGRALMAGPKLLLLDEPSMGLAPVLVDTIFDTIKQLHERGTTILLVEQNARMALQVADRGYVLQTGGMVLSGTVAELQANEMVRRAYLGIG